MRVHSSVEYIEVDNSGTGWKVEIQFAGHRHAYDRFNRTTKTQLPVIITNFECRNCGNTNFEAIHTTKSPFTILQESRHNRYGPQTGPKLVTKWIKSYFCPGCTTAFQDPAKFSKNQPPHIIPPVATEQPSKFELTESDLEEIREAEEKLRKKIKSTIQPID